MSESLAIQLEVHIAPGRLGSTRRVLDSVDSTNLEARRWIDEGATAECAVVADYQSAGRGRHGRRWDAEPEDNLTFTAVVRSPPPESMGLVPLVSALAVAAALRSACPRLEARLKWPNDVLVDGRKVCGILVETARDSIGPVLLVGIGLNVNQAVFPPDLSGRASSLFLESGVHWKRGCLMAGVLENLEDWLGRLRTEGPAFVAPEFEEEMVGLGEPATVRSLRELPAQTGVIKGIANDGALQLETDSGMLLLRAGDVTLAPE